MRLLRGPPSEGALSAVQVILALDRPIWPDGFFDVVCPGGFFPEFWVTRYPAEPGYEGPQLFGITGFACGERAERMADMREAALVRATLAQLDEIFGAEFSSCSIECLLVRDDGQTWEHTSRCRQGA